MPIQPAAAGHALVGRQLSNLALMKRMLALTWRFRAGCARAVLVQMVQLGLSLSGLGLVGVGIDVIHHALNNKAPSPRWPWGISPPADWPALHLVLTVSVGILTLAIIRASLAYANTVMQTRLIQDIVVHLRSLVYDKLQRLSFRFYDANESGSIINRVTGDVQGVRMFVDGVIIQGMNLLLSLSFFLVYMLSIHKTLTLVCLATTPLLLISAITFSRMVKPAYWKNRQLFDRAILTLSENVQGVHVVKGFSRQPQEMAKFRDVNRAVKDQKQWIFWCITIFTPLTGMLTQINLTVLLFYGGYLVHLYNQDPSQGIPLGTGLMVFAGVLQQFSGQIESIANITNSVQQSLTAADRVFEVLDTPIEIESKADAVQVKRLAGAVAFEHVTFAYKASDPVLIDVNFQVGAGQCVAILGATGAGKSTLLSLIPRFYDADRGRLLIDGIDVRDMNLDDLRRNIGLVFQENFLFSNTVAANIAFGHPDATAAQIETAARIAAAHDFITKLPKSYDTLLGERATNLSGGQRQRLAIARALLLDPAILILDDATAAVDPQTEHEILTAMDNAMRDRTTFVVAHRLSTLRRSDLVVVLEGGRIVQMGTHDELMRTGGHYRKAAKLQLVDEESARLLGMAGGVA
ncbi:MAG: ABC transporter ATP-binding protein [Phycisphaeraceae bacterium]